MMQIRDEHLITLRYEPWRDSQDPNNNEINEPAFTEWYGLMLIIIRTTERIPRQLFDEFSQDTWFRVTHGHTHIRLRCIHLETFEMRKKIFVLSEATFHSEVGSWPRVACEITKGKYIYLFEGMRPQVPT